MALEVRSRPILRFRVFEVDVRARELRKQGVRIKLQEQPFHILTVLLQRPGEVVTREELRSQNWPADTFVDFDNSLNTAINKLREALGQNRVSSGKLILVATMEGDYRNDLVEKIALVKPQMIILDSPADAKLVGGVQIDLRNAKSA